jgi:hypothetical protein
LIFRVFSDRAIDEIWRSAPPLRRAATPRPRDLDGADTEVSRERGTRDLLDKLDGHLKN